MSITSVRDALEIKLNAMTPIVAIAWQNIGYTPVTGTPYQACYLMPARPDNPTMGCNHYREQGIFQVSLFYPLLVGSLAAEARAELIRTTFKRGVSMTSGGVTVRISKTPEIGQGRVDGDRWHVPVKIVWFAEIYY